MHELSNSASAREWTMPLVVRLLWPVRVLLGACGLAHDGAQDVIEDPAFAMDRVERRGLRLQREVRLELRRLERRGSAEARRLSFASRHPVQWMQESIVETGQYAEDELERQVERVLARMGIPTRERLEKLRQEIDALSARIDDELLALANETRESRVGA